MCLLILNATVKIECDYAENSLDSVGHGPGKYLIDSFVEDGIDHENEGTFLSDKSLS